MNLQNKHKPLLVQSNRVESNIKYMALLKIILFHVSVSNLSRTIVGYVRGEDTVVKERLWKYKYSLC